MQQIFYKFGGWIMTAFASVAIYMLAFMPGCATLEGEIGPRLATGVDTYCTQPLEVRRVTRASSDRVLKESADKRKAQPAIVRIWCPGDPDYPVTPSSGSKSSDERTANI